MAELKDVRAAYKAATGKNPSPRDDAAALERKIAEHNAATAAPAAEEPAEAAEAPEAAEIAPEAPEVAPEAPEGCAYVRHPDGASCSFEGVSLEPDKDGNCLVPLRAVEALAPHGFKLVKGA